MSDIANDTTYTITDLAREFDVTTRTIRFYEDEGLLSPERIGRNRLYNQRDRTRLMLILRGKRLGFALGEIRELFDLYDMGKDQKPQLRLLLDRIANKRLQLEQQKTDIEIVLSEMDSLTTRCREILGE
ncbi:DNA-binding transcriptional MerR regulator [Chitinivorax tropicus]|uniref:DNA-binding transcriptional MerR regulator n=1 Tax=Chitinivorax tropicus TaxID=714531 RepID=A0A840MNH7_9PROT|nr:MerR family DNA-binding transcriptional regulator [Chitinivorax tropicus]MBB5018547.1 DNA-binding transcriptional MerR regulator [Chitinivorax tropicus]